MLFTRTRPGDEARAAGAHGELFDTLDASLCVSGFSFQGFLSSFVRLRHIDFHCFRVFFSLLAFTMCLCVYFVLIGNSHEVCVHWFALSGSPSCLL